MTSDFDIVIVGGGLVGAATALALRDSELRIALVETASPPALPDDESWDSRIYAISPGNARFLSRLGAWEAMDVTRIAPIDAMHIWGDDGVARLEFNAYEAHAPNLGYIVESRLMQAALWQALERVENITLLSRARCTQIVWKDAAVELDLEGGRRLTGALVVGADGANSWIRQQAGLSVELSDYRQMGVVANFLAESPHRNIARQWFREDGVLAWLPLPGNHISIVWSTSHTHAKMLLAMSPGVFTQAVVDAGGGVLGSLQMVTSPAAFPLRMQTAESLVGTRLALVGDAAHLVHPMAGQGVNLGFHDAENLARILAGRSPRLEVGDHALLRCYERSRKADIQAMQSLTGGLHALFGCEIPGIARLRNWGMGFTNGQQWLKRRLMAHAMT